jgi:excisionase family DNA binding protein
MRGSDTQSRLGITTLKRRWSRVTNPYEFAPILVGRVEAARLLSISVPEIDRLRRNGELVARRRGRRVLFAVAELQRYADTQPADE